MWALQKLKSSFIFTGNNTVSTSVTVEGKPVKGETLVEFVGNNCIFRSTEGRFELKYDPYIKDATGWWLNASGNKETTMKFHCGYHEGDLYIDGPFASFNFKVISRRTLCNIS